jgi:hypothetical protein
MQATEVPRQILALKAAPAGIVAAPGTGGFFMTTKPARSKYRAM